MNATATRRRKQAKPKPLTCAVARRPVCPCELIPEGAPGLVEINGDEYGLSYIAELPEAGEPRVYGYRFHKDDGTTYDIPADASGCECMGHMRWGVACKHIQSVRQLFGTPAPKLTSRFAAETI